MFNSMVLHGTLFLSSTLFVLRVSCHTNFRVPGLLAGAGTVGPQGGGLTNVHVYENGVGIKAGSNRRKHFDEIVESFSLDARYSKIQGFAEIVHAESVAFCTGTPAGDYFD